MKLKLGTRGSDLALTQSGWVAARLAEHGIEAELVVISTSGDRSQAPSFGSIGPQGVFVREIEQALLDGEIDCAVHSYKDLPTQSPAGLVVAATPARRDPADWLLFRAGAIDGAEADGSGAGDSTAAASADAAGTGGATGATATLPQLGHGARVGTSSARRQAWLRHLRPDLVIEPLRGNVPTRIGRLAAGDYDAIILAGAGIERLDEHSDVLAAALAGVSTTRLDPTLFVPAPAQGALAIQCREDSGSDSVQSALGLIDDATTTRAVDLERETLRLAEGGCDAAFGAWARVEGDGFELIVMAESDGRVRRASVSGKADLSSMPAAALERLRQQTEGAA